MKNRNANALFWFCPIFALIIALLEMPYGYYQLLRVFICGAALYFVSIENTSENGPWFWLFIFCAIIYNPIVKLHLGRDIWQLVNVITIVVLVLHYIKRRDNVGQ